MFGRCARTAATFWVFLTLGTTGFFSRAPIAFDFRAGRVELVRASFFFALAAERLAAGCFDRASDLEVAVLDPFRATDLVGEALFALGWFDLAFTVPRLAGFETERPVELLLVDLVKPLVTGLLIRRSK